MKSEMKPEETTQREMASKALADIAKKRSDEKKSEMKTEETNIHHIITQLASTSTSTPDFQDDEDLRTCRRCCNCYRQRFCCRPTCFLRSAAMPAEAAPGGMTTPDGNKKEQFWGVGPWGGLGWGGLGWGGLGWGRGWGWGW
ncbi:hypothetical protein DD237_002286 [Peronospora effusa]|uniref:Uncharacterized protein n=1 Tax=Peronospora effusa TaxID=542832 RepID=A0A3R7WKQ4_9STRA|nr:hypothetical protein DD237_002286 [Peronospora effusa]